MDYKIFKLHDEIRYKMKGIDIHINSLKDSNNYAYIQEPKNISKFQFNILPYKMIEIIIDFDISFQINKHGFHHIKHQYCIYGNITNLDLNKYEIFITMKQFITALHSE